MIIIRTNLVDLESTMLYAKIQPQSFLGSGEEHFQECLPFTRMSAILFNCAGPFEQTGKTHLTEGDWSHVKSGKNCSNGFEKKFKNYTIILYKYIAQGARVDNPLGTKL